MRPFVFGRVAARSVAVALLTSLILALAPVSPVLADSPPSSPPNLPLAYPTVMPGIKVAVAHDGLDANGHWTQVVQLTIESGGTLADASMVVYGDTNHVDQIFAAARQKNPSLTAPAMIPAGQEIDLNVDPSATYVLAAVLTTPDTIVQRFANGVVSTIYLHPTNSLKQVIAFPDGTPTDLFIYPGSTAPIKARPGGRIVDLVYQKGDSFGTLVDAAYGLTSFAAAQDLTKQSGWDPTHWPPPTGQEKLVVVGPKDLYSAAPPAVTPIPNPDPAGRALQQQLAARRTRIGVYPVRLESFGTVYHIAVNDPTVTASALSQVVYGNTAHRDDLARAAGFQVPADNGGKSTKAFDPHLLGQSFDLTVDYVDENFVVGKQTRNGATTVELADGASVTSYAPADSGPMQVVAYPTGYKRIDYRPPKTYLTIAQGLALLYTAQNLNLSGATVTRESNQYVAEALWRVAPGIPKSSSDIADSLQLLDSPSGPYLEALLAPPAPRNPVDATLGLLQVRSPIKGILVLVLAGIALVVLVDLARRHFAHPRRVRW
ncbi:MAG TPA: hypothetical protein VFZ25_19070 [Chloroflexota bacterium]|nr:hypothetical protein [Chloroflexota bacterium]